MFIVSGFRAYFSVLLTLSRVFLWCQDVCGAGVIAIKYCEYQKQLIVVINTAIVIYEYSAISYYKKHRAIDYILYVNA